MSTAQAYEIHEGMPPLNIHWVVFVDDGKSRMVAADAARLFEIKTGRPPGEVWQFGKLYYCGPVRADELRKQVAGG